MKKNVFKIKRESVSGEYIHYLAQVNDAHAVFNGHFPQNPVVPGVCTMEMLKQCVSDATGRGLRYEYIKECKFLAAILPQEHKQLGVQIQVKEEGELIHVTAEVVMGEIKMMKLKASLKER